MSGEERPSRNIQACLDWIERHRGDEVAYVRALLEADAFGNDKARAIVALMAQGFEAGREFQKANPSVPLGGGAHYLPDAKRSLGPGDRVRMRVSKPVLRTDVGLGEKGTIILWDDDVVAIRLDRPVEILDEWDNELIWTPDDLADDAIAATVPELVEGLVEPLDEPNDRETRVQAALDFLDSMADGQGDDLGRRLRAIRVLIEELARGCI